MRRRVSDGLQARSDTIKMSRDDGEHRGVQRKIGKYTD